MDVQQERSRYDSAAPRRSYRKGRERGVWIFVPAAELRAAGFDPHGEPPTYRVWGRPGGSLFGRFYR